MTSRSETGSWYLQIGRTVDKYNDRYHFINISLSIKYFEYVFARHCSKWPTRCGEILQHFGS